MKKIFAVVVGAFAGLTTTFAQDVDLVLKVGANVANQTVSGGAGSFTPESRLGFHGGLYITAMVSESFGIQPELLYNNVGSKAEILGQEYVRKLTYLSVPVMLRYNPIPILNIHAGPQFGFLMFAKIHSENRIGDIKDQLKGLDIGMGMGIGIDLPMGVVASARYSLGLSNIADTQGDEKLTNNVIQISLGYKLTNLGK